ncbi:MAG: lipopolysaccharide transport system permease protein [Chloroflexota bacterium]|jgi:ABC-type polysaccharide/polyol phosphate export permease|nr:lipopolysaccharide transport system permease protein [Chloroflexota bacterium]
MATLVATLQESARYRGLLRNLLARDLSVRYKNSVLGFVWTLLNPLLLTLVFTLVFQVLIPSDVPHFPVFILVGLLAWNFCVGSVMACIHSVVGNANLVRKVYFPREMLPLSAVLANLVNFVLALSLVFVMVPLFGIPLTPLVLWVPITIVFQTAFLAGLGLILAAVNVFFRDTEAIMDVAILAWFFLTPVFYPLDVLFSKTVGPVNLGWLMHALNPMASFIATYRLVLVDVSPPDLAFLARTFASSLAILVIGYGLFKWLEPRFGEEL